EINKKPPWADKPNSWANFFSGLAALASGAATPLQNVNPCGGATDLVFGRNVTTPALGLESDGQCKPIQTGPKMLVANLSEPAITAVQIMLEGAQRHLGDVVPQAMRTLGRTSSLTGEELFVTEGFREALSKEPGIQKASRLISDAELAKLELCIPPDGRPL